ncbi:hypothetical protein [Winogradskyella psychrotolerans]|uniref:hypothetical protein n=1 Tax=Winogradskyella psychrotolerans TaxID=1344585 RepID=UPI001C06EF74|nr:hypothetical protein [Winogradskyella psychrotolerans]MBU2929115.1 hypothetical protein [Winogradskyella psychrotolerans]
MEKVNYITQLNAVFELFNKDHRIKQGHITLYLAFFQKWNREFFKTTITVNRELIMERAKFKSKTTYHNYLRELNDWDYLQYYPSYHPAIGSKIKMSIFFVQAGQNLANSVPELGQILVSSYKHKTKENFNKLARPKNELEVLSFFKENNWPAIEGKKFYAYYQAKNWKLSRGLKIKNWKQSAKNFVERGFKIKEKYTSPFSGYVDNLKNNNVKDYDIPL